MKPPVRKKNRIDDMASLAVQCASPIPWGWAPDWHARALRGIKPSALRDLRDGGECEVFADLLIELTSYRSLASHPGEGCPFIAVLHLLVTPIEPARGQVHWHRQGRAIGLRPEEVRAWWDAVVRDQPPSPFLPRAFHAAAIFAPIAPLWW